MSIIKIPRRMKFSLDGPRSTAIGGRFKIFSIIIIAAFLTTSCVLYQNQKLPPDWTLTVSGSGDRCPNISGEYNNVGEDTNKAEQSLVQLFFQKELREDRTLRSLLEHRTTHISLQQPDEDSLHIMAWRDKEMLYSKVLSMKSGDFKCENGLLTITLNVVDAAYLTLAKSWGTISIAKSGDFLLMKGEMKTSGAILLFPLVGSESIWIRFSAVKGTGARELQPKTAYLTDKRILSPRFSPDGKEIVFVLESYRASRIYKVNVDGTNLTLLSRPGDYDRDPVYSPDGKTVLFTSLQDDWQGDLCLMKSDGSGKVFLTKGPEQDFNPIFSPDGSKVYFIRALSYDNNWPLNMRWWQDMDIYSINIDGTGLTRITQMQLSHLTDLSIHSDGKRLLARMTVKDRPAPWIIPLENPDNLESVQSLIGECDTKFFSSKPAACYPSDLLKPMFSPNGNSLLFQWIGSNANIPYKQVYVMDLETRQERKISNVRPEVVTDASLVDASFSYDGCKIVFSALENRNVPFIDVKYSYAPKLWIVNSDGSNLHSVDF